MPNNRPTKVLHLTDGLTHDGAEMMTCRLHLGLRNAGIDSKVLSLVRPEQVPHTTRFRSSLSYSQRKLDSLLKNVSLAVGLNGFFDIGSFKIKHAAAYLAADVLISHQHSSLSPLALPQLTKNKPAILALHDMASLTGHCSHSFDCERWKIGCGQCPYPDSPPAIRRDSTRLGWKLKDWAYSRSNLAVVSPSVWLYELTQKSMLNRFPLYHIPNGVETETYQPLEREQCRSLLGIPPHKKVLMVGAVRLTNYIKGGDLLLQALHQLPKSLKTETILLLLGNGGEAIANSVEMETVSLGFVGNSHLQAICYSAADLFIHSSRAESLSNVILQSMSCGTPIVAFKVGGIPDLVRPGITGYLAESGNTKDFCDGIVQLLEDQRLRHCMQEHCRKIAVKEFSMGLYIQRYISLIHELQHKSRQPEVPQTFEKQARVANYPHSGKS